MTPEQIVAFENYIAAERALTEAWADQSVAHAAALAANDLCSQRYTERDQAQKAMLAAWADQSVAYAASTAANEVVSQRYTERDQAQKAMLVAMGVGEEE